MSALAVRFGSESDVLTPLVAAANLVVSRVFRPAMIVLFAHGIGNRPDRLTVAPIGTVPVCFSHRFSLGTSGMATYLAEDAA
jgi:hypothetical protein